MIPVALPRLSVSNSTLLRRGPIDKNTWNAGDTTLPLRNFD